MRKEIDKNNYKTKTKEQNQLDRDYFFTVVVCTYNRDKILPRALNSLTKQKFKDFEVIVVDDGSSDRTFSVVKEYRNLLNLRYIYQQNKGLSLARNVGGFSANGVYITFLDSDDEYKSHHLASRYKILSENQNIDLLLGGVEVVGNNLVPDANNPDSLIEISNCVVGGTFFIKKEFFRKLEGFRALDFADDYDFYKRAVAEKANIVEVQLPSYIYYRDMDDSICNTLMKKKSK